jgi:hypothetical protein
MNRYIEREDAQILRRRAIAALTEMTRGPVALSGWSRPVAR